MGSYAIFSSHVIRKTHLKDLTIFKENNDVKPNIKLFISAINKKLPHIP